MKKNGKSQRSHSRTDAELVHQSQATIGLGPTVKIMSKILQFDTLSCAAFLLLLLLRHLTEIVLSM